MGAVLTSASTMTIEAKEATLPPRLFEPRLQVKRKHVRRAGGRVSEEGAGFVSDGASRLERHLRQQIQSDVAAEFAPQLKQSRGFGRLVVRFRRWIETQRRIEAASPGNSNHTNWLKR